MCRPRVKFGRHYLTGLKTHFQLIFKERFGFKTHFEEGYAARHDRASYRSSDSSDFAGMLKAGFWGPRCSAVRFAGLE